MLTTYSGQNPEVLSMIIVNGFAISLNWHSWGVELPLTENVLELEDGTSYLIKDQAWT